MLRTVSLFLAVALFLPAATLFAQPSTQPAMATVALGQSAVALYGPWKFHLGDSPIDPKTGKPLWAEPDFDDSGWDTVSLHPQPGWSDPFNGDPRYVPGWTAKAHPGYMGYAWYRLRVPLAAEPGTHLALACPTYVDDGYQVFANDVLLGGFGKFDIPGKPPLVTYTTPAMLPLQQSSSPSAANPKIQAIAFRVWMGPMGLTHNPYAGGLHYAPWIGERAVIEEHTRLDRLELVRENAYAPFEGVLLFLLGVVAASLILFDRSDPVYLWVSGVLIFTALSDAALTVFTMTQYFSLRTYFMFFDVFSNPLALFGWIMVWWYWFRLQRPAWLPATIGALTLLYLVTKAIGGDFFYGVNPQPPAMAFNAISVAARFALVALLIVVVVLGIRKQGAEGWLVTFAVVPVFVSQFASELISHNLPVKWSPFGITIFVGQVATLVSAAALSLLLLRRLQQSVLRQRQMALDVKQAQEVQQVIMPEQRVVLLGFEIESEYRPAREVGGDFFQIIPNEKDGSLLIVAGDVTGKGLKAGMLVALLVGAIRSTAELVQDPRAILSALNRRLLGRSDARATCLALRILRDGSATLANSGDLPPYLNGALMQIDGSLPLGMVEQFDCSVHHFQLAPNDRLLMLSDGVAEATDQDGGLFGFERVLELVRTGPTAAQIAQTAQAFGQQDDISVITVTRSAAHEPAPA